MKNSTKKIGFISLVVFLCLNKISAKESQFADISSPPGMFIWSGNLKNHFYCVGEGSPTVILQSGIGGYSLDWILVQPKLAELTRVCSYDRAGYGWSGTGSLPRTASRIVKELEKVLRLSGEEPPYILVGHSYGGLISQFFASQYSEIIAGLVLVDSTSANQFERMESTNKVSTLSPTGSNFVLYNTSSVPANLPTEYKSLAMHFARRRQTSRVIYSELRHFRESTTILAQLPAITPDRIPAVVIRRAKNGTADPRANRREMIWHQLQRELADLHHAPLLTSTTSNHYVQLSEPALVVTGLVTVLDAIKLPIK